MLRYLHDYYIWKELSRFIYTQTGKKYFAMECMYDLIKTFGISVSGRRYSYVLAGLNCG